MICISISWRKRHYSVPAHGFLGADFHPAVLLTTAMTAFYVVMPILVLMLAFVLRMLSQVLDVLIDIHEVLEEGEIDHDDIMLDDYPDE